MISDFTDLVVVDRRMIDNHRSLLHQVEYLPRRHQMIVFLLMHPDNQNIAILNFLDNFSRRSIHITEIDIELLIVKHLELFPSKYSWLSCIWVIHVRVGADEQNFFLFALNFLFLFLNTLLCNFCQPLPIFIKHIYWLVVVVNILNLNIVFFSLLQISFTFNLFSS